MSIGTRMIWWVSVIVSQISAAQPLTVGQAAPKLVIGTIEQGRVEEKLGSKATVLEFWATWCPPCREAIPRLNELAEQFKDRPIDFLSLTPESEETVMAFLKTHLMRGIVALDPGGKMFQSYGAGLPTTAFITASGKIAGVTHDPERITPAMLEDLLSERPIDLPAISSFGPRRALAIGTKIDDSAALVKIVITPVFQQSGSVDTEDQFESTGSTLPELLAFAYNVSPIRLVVPMPLQQRIYAVQARVPPRHADQLRPLMQNALAATAGIQARWETRSVDVLVLQGLPGKLRESPRDLPASRPASLTPGHLSGDGAELDKLRQQIEAVVDKPVIVERPASMKVQYELDWDVTRPGSFAAALRDQLGLELKPEQRELEILVVEDRQDTKPIGKIPSRSTRGFGVQRFLRVCDVSIGNWSAFSRRTIVAVTSVGTCRRTARPMKE